MEASTSGEQVLAELDKLVASHGRLWWERFRTGSGPHHEPPQLAAGTLALLWAELEEHMRREEEFLVPKLLPHLGDRVGPLASALQEHRRLRAMAKEVLARVAGGGHPDEERVLVEFPWLVEDHLLKEDHVLYPLAREILGAGVSHPR